MLILILAALVGCAPATPAYDACEDYVATRCACTGDAQRLRDCEDEAAYTERVCGAYTETDQALDYFVCAGDIALRECDVYTYTDECGQPA